MLKASLMRSLSNTRSRSVVIQASSISCIKIQGPDSDQASENSLLINFLHRLLAPGMSIANPRDLERSTLYSCCDSFFSSFFAELNAKPLDSRLTTNPIHQSANPVAGGTRWIEAMALFRPDRSGDVDVGPWDGGFNKLFEEKGRGN